jgi:nitrogen fixation NifU-like protein
VNAATDTVQAFYKERVLAHSREPHNFRTLDEPTLSAEGFNPLCGDKVTIYLKIDGGRIKDAAFGGVGCAISIASASMLTDVLIGVTEQDAEAILQSALNMFRGQDASADDPYKEQLTELRALESVRSYPSRIKCATLAWSTLEAALHGQQQEVTTE